MPDLPPSGPWTGYYLYGHDGVRHRMQLHLTFSPNGAIHGDGIDDIARFVISGRFHAPTGSARWTKAYLGLHAVDYSGLYCPRAICGDWRLPGLTGGFWIWPRGEGGAETEEAPAEVELPVAALLSSPSD